MNWLTSITELTQKWAKPTWSAKTNFSKGNKLKSPVISLSTEIVINGNFTTWSSWSTCTLTCGNGTQQRMRTCTNPTPFNGGKNCTGHYREAQNCNTQSCPSKSNRCPCKNYHLRFNNAQSVFCCWCCCFVVVVVDAGGLELSLLVLIWCCRFGVCCCCCFVVSGGLLLFLLLLVAGVDILLLVVVVFFFVVVVLGLMLLFVLVCCCFLYFSLVYMYTLNELSS